jgi:hypothetical protein
MVLVGLCACKPVFQIRILNRIGFTFNGRLVPDPHSVCESGSAFGMQIRICIRYADPDLDLGGIKRTKMKGKEEAKDI